MVQVKSSQVSQIFGPFVPQFGMKIRGTPPLDPSLQVVVSIRQPSSNLLSAD